MKKIKKKVKAKMEKKPKNRKKIKKEKQIQTKKKLKVRKLEKKEIKKTKATIKKLTKEKIKPIYEKVDLNWLVDLFKDPLLRKKLVEIGGEETIEVLKGLTKYTSDEDISNNCKIKISDVRAVLNKLHGAGLVNYDKTKDEKSWFIYHWHIKKEALAKLAEDVKKESETNFKNINPYEYYFCPNCQAAQEIHQDDAAVTDYFCPVCNNPLLPLAEREIFIKNPDKYIIVKNEEINKTIDYEPKEEIAIEIDINEEDEDTTEQVDDKKEVKKKKIRKN